MSEIFHAHDGQRFEVSSAAPPVTLRHVDTGITLTVPPGEFVALPRAGAWRIAKRAGLVPVPEDPPFVPELVDAPMTGESGAVAPLLVDAPVHDSTLPAELPGLYDS